MTLYEVNFELHRLPEKKYSHISHEVKQALLRMAMKRSFPQNYLAHFLNTLSANPTKWFDHFVGLALKGLISQSSAE